MISRQSKSRVLVFAAHPDDEVLGCGGTIAYHRAKEEEVGVCYISEGVSSRFNFEDYKIRQKWEKEMFNREEMAKNAASILDFQIIDFLRLPNLRMNDINILDIAKKLIKIIEKFKPDIVYVNFPGDMNSDHKVTFDSVFTALRPSAHHNVNDILCYEVLSSTEWAPSISKHNFQPNTFIDITNYFDTKIKSINAYNFEMRSEPHPRSKSTIKSLCVFRGSQIGVKYAESFMSIRRLLK